MLQAQAGALRRGTIPLVAFLLASIGVALTPLSVCDAGSPGSRIQGRIIVSRREPVVGAVVSAVRTGGLAKIFATATDGRGDFRLDGLEDGDYRLTVRREGMGTLVKDPITLKYPYRAIIELQMVPTAPGVEARSPTVADPGTPPGAHTVSGIVKQAEGAPLGEAQVRLVRADGSVDPVAAMTSAEGSFSFSSLPAGAWSAEIHAPGFLPLHMPVEVAGDSTLVVTLVTQPATYEPPPADQLPPEEPIPPSD